MHRRIEILLSLVACLLSGCMHVAPRAADDEKALREADAAIQEALARRDLERTMSFYAEDAVLLPAAEPLIRGKAAIREEWKHLFAIPDFRTTSTLTRVEVARSADLAYTMGTYLATMMGEDGREVTEPGKWVSVWKKQPDGSWRIVVDTYNTDVPPPDHK